MSVPSSCLLVFLIFLPLAWLLPQYFPAHWWPLAYMLSLQVSCGVTNLVYMIYRRENAVPELDVIKVTALSSITAIGSMVRGGGAGSKDPDSSPDTPAKMPTLPRVNSRSNFGA